MGEFAEFLRAEWARDEPDLVHTRFSMSGLFGCGLRPGPHPYDADLSRAVIAMSVKGSARRRFAAERGERLATVVTGQSA